MAGVIAAKQTFMNKHYVCFIFSIEYLYSDILLKKYINFIYTAD